MVWLPDGEKISKIFYSFWQNVRTWQTDRQTPHDDIGRAYASHRAAKTVSRIVCHNSCIEPGSSFHHFATPLRASTRYVSDRSRWIQVCVRNVSYAYSIFRKIRTYANVFYFSILEPLCWSRPSLAHNHSVHLWPVGDLCPMFTDVRSAIIVFPLSYKHANKRRRSTTVPRLYKVINTSGRIGL